MNLKDLKNIISPKELNKIKRRVAKMDTKTAQEELKLRLKQFNELTNQINTEEEEENKK